MVHLPLTGGGVDQRFTVIVLPSKKLTVGLNLMR
jgi:hypothetical protein